MEFLKDRDDEQKREIFRVSRRVANRINRRKKRELMNNQIREIENNRRLKKTKDQYKGINEVG